MKKKEEKKKGTVRLKSVKMYTSDKNKKTKNL